MVRPHAARSWLVASLSALAVMALGAAATPARAASGAAATSAPVLVDVSAVQQSGELSNQQGKVFRHPGGEAKLAREKQEGRGQAPTRGIQSQPSGPAPATTSTPTLGPGFPGITDAESYCGCYPPDGAIGVSASYVVAAVNSAFKVWDSAGTNLVPASSLGGLFAPNAACLPNLSDPSVQYDAAAGGHFTIEALTYDSAYNSSLCLAVSTTADPTASYYVYGFPVNPAGDLMDFPQLAIGSDAIYVSGNQFQNGVTFTGARVYAFGKLQMYSGAIAGSIYHDVGNNSLGVGHPADTLYPAKNVSVANTMYFVAADNNAATGNNVSVWKWSSPFGANAFTLQGGIVVTTYAQPPPALQPGGTTDSGDVRTLGAAYYQGTVYGVHTIGCNPGGGTVPCLQWYQISNVDGVPSLTQQGILGGAGQSRYYPNLSVDQSGDLLLGYAYASTTEYPGVRGTGRAPTDTPGTLQSEGLLKAGEALIDGTRYGDYAGEQLAPDGCTVWHLEEYAQAGALWGTWVSTLKMPGCTPVASPALSFNTSPSALTAGTPSGSMTVSRSSSASTSSTVTLTTTSSGGGFATTTGGPFAASLSVSIPAGRTSSGSFYYRDTVAGSPRLSAASPGYTSASQALTVTPGPLTTITVSPPSTSVGVGGTVPYTASGTDAYNNAVGIVPAWSVSPALGTFAPPSGASTTFTAGNSTGSGTITATVGSVTGTAAITVTAAPPPPPTDCNNC